MSDTLRVLVTSCNHRSKLPRSATKYWYTWSTRAVWIMYYSFIKIHNFSDLNKKSKNTMLVAITRSLHMGTRCDRGKTSDISFFQFTDVCLNVRLFHINILTKLPWYLVAARVIIITTVRYQTAVIRPSIRIHVFEFEKCKLWHGATSSTVLSVTVIVEDAKPRKVPCPEVLVP